MLGEMIGSYRVTARLGAGAIGVVYLAEHPLIGRKVAIKLLLPEYSSDPEMVMRFFREARSTATIGHPGLVDVLDFGQHPSGAAYLVMEFLPGETLSALLARLRVLPPAMLVSIAEQIAGAANAAHEQGIIHRDLKPDNIILVPAQDYPFGVRVKVLDFGIAKIAHAEASKQTRMGKLLGTPLYMSPEQCMGSTSVDRRADIYSLGCIMYEMACGSPPFGGDNVWHILKAQRLEAPVPPRKLTPTLPQALESAILHALEKAPEKRPQSMTALVDELRWAVPPAGKPSVQLIETSTLREPNRPGGPEPARGGAPPIAAPLRAGHVVAPGDATLPEARVMPLRPKHKSRKKKSALHNSALVPILIVVSGALAVVAIYLLIAN